MLTACERPWKQQIMIPSEGIYNGSQSLPIQNFYSREVVADSDGVWTTSVRDTVLNMHQDVYASECNM